MKRNHLPRRQMSDSIQRWLKVTAYRHFWRVSADPMGHGVCELDDLVQDGYMHYARIIKRYPDDDPTAIRRKFQRAFMNHINDLSVKRTKERRALTEADFRDTEHELGTLQVLMAQAPPTIKTVLRVFSDQSGLQQLQASDGNRETISQQLARVTGLNASDLRVQFARYFKG